MEFAIVSSEYGLSEFLECSKNVDLMSIDVEFMSQKTSYFPRLCLLQVFIKSRCFIFDTILYDFHKHLKPLLEDMSIVKVFCDARQDISIINREMNIVTKNIFDIQIAHMFLYSDNDQPGYKYMVDFHCRCEISKSMQTTNWSKRPLPIKAIEYASRDVVFLPRIYDILKKKLIDNNKMIWFQSDMKDIENGNEIDINKAYKKCNLNGLCDDEVKSLKIMAKIREEIAISRNIFRDKVVKDDIMIDIVKSKNIDDLASKVEKYYIDKEFRSKFENTLDQISFDKNKIDYRLYDNKIINKIKSIIKISANEKSMSKNLFAKKEDIIKLARIIEDNGIKSVINMQIFSGWRGELVGSKILKEFEVLDN
jgi:ribonuclease D